ncbi:hypothetical protein [Haloferax sp. YSSS75]|uniref:hypothetical protein n=1 Tax=Haloferax sp. YSSS75 TaxID=3388564 RepID=UPI00398CCF51
MQTYKLVPYWIRLRRKHETDNYWDLTNLSNSLSLTGRSFISLFEEFCTAIPGTEIDPEAERTFTVEDWESGNNTIEGTFVGGNYGRGAGHYDTVEDERDPDARPPKIAVEQPYYFFCHVPQKDRTRALFLLEKAGNKGVKTHFDRVFKREFIESIDRNVHVDMNPVVDADLVEQILEADRILKLKLEKQQKSAALHDDLGHMFDSDGGALKEQIELKASRGESLPVIKRGIERVIQALQNTETSAVELHGQEFDEAKFQIEKNGSKRTISIFKDEVAMERIVDPKSDDLLLDHQRHPVPSSISEIAREYANEILRRYGENTVSTESQL